jgi:hypothetical protein
MKITPPRGCGLVVEMGCHRINDPDSNLERYRALGQCVLWPSLTDPLVEVDDDNAELGS